VADATAAIPRVVLPEPADVPQALSAALFQKIRELSTDLAIYGFGDVAISIINFLLLPIYLQYLTPEDYGALALLGSVEVIAKIFFRWGLDGSFMRYLYEYEENASRQRLASTIFLFLLAVNGVLLVISLALSPVLSQSLFNGGPYLRALQLTLLNTFLIGFTFFPFHVLRIEKRAAQFSALTLARSVSTLLLRIVLIIGLGYGVTGVVLADLLVTAALMLVLLKWFRKLIRPVFSNAMLREALKFGLPRIPHAAAQQVIAVGDKFVLIAFRPLQEVGVYSIGVSIGLTQKLFLSAFEYAWAPFYYANAREPDAQRLFSVMTTYGVAVLAVMTAGLSAIGGDLLAAVAGDQAAYYVPAADVVTWTAVGVFFQGAYLLTSIGLNISKNTQYYPVVTSVAAASNLALNFLLVPRFGMIGAAWANAVAYAVQAILAFRFAQRFYPVQYETRRLATVTGAAIVACLSARALPEMAPITGIIVRGAAVIVLYTAILAISGFLKPEELRALRALRPRPAVQPVTEAPEVFERAGEILAADLRHDEVSPVTPTGGRT
jgi:O-antigen/teichoic acid export membrane protein